MLYLTIFFKWANPSLYLLYFRLFKHTLQFLLQINVKKCPSSIWCRDSNSYLLEHESPPINTRPGLPTFNDILKSQVPGNDSSYIHFWQKWMYFQQFWVPKSSSKKWRIKTTLILATWKYSFWNNNNNNKKSRLFFCWRSSKHFRSLDGAPPSTVPIISRTTSFHIPPIGD